MGFSTSGAVAIMLIAFLVAASVIFPTVFTAGADTGSAFAAQADQSRDLANTDIQLTSAEQEYEPPTEAEDETYGTLTVTVVNDGTTSLDVRDTDLLLDGTFVPQFHDGVETTVIVDKDGENEQRRGETDIWSPGTHLEFTVDEAVLQETVDEEPEAIDRVKVVAENGLADATNDVTVIDSDDDSEPEEGE